MAKMANIFKDSLKAQGYVIPRLEQYLFRQVNKPNDRAIDVNAPSAAGGCIRSNYYARKQYKPDRPISTRTQRIFNNGDYVHIRLQRYLMDEGILLMDEVPLINDEYNIQGHTDGYLKLDSGEIAILEIKSINDRQFGQLKDAKPEHKRQGMVYMYCAEERRKWLRLCYDSDHEFIAGEQDRTKYFESHYQHMKDGSKYSREEKIANEVDLNLMSDDVLFHSTKPVSKVIFLYENKNNQELKEFCVSYDKDILSHILSAYMVLNRSCEESIVPVRPKEATGKSCGFCKWCDYVNTCWVI